MTPIRGWAPRGQKLIARAPFGHWRTLTFLAALRHDRIDAPCVLDGPINGQSFTAKVAGPNGTAIPLQGSLGDGGAIETTLGERPFTGAVYAPASASASGR